MALVKMIFPIIILIGSIISGQTRVIPRRDTETRRAVDTAEQTSTVDPEISLANLLSSELLHKNSPSTQSFGRNETQNAPAVSSQLNNGIPRSVNPNVKPNSNDLTPNPTTDSTITSTSMNAAITTILASSTQLDESKPGLLETTVVLARLKKVDKSQLGLNRTQALRMLAQAVRNRTLRARSPSAQSTTTGKTTIAVTKSGEFNNGTSLGRPEAQRILHGIENQTASPIGAADTTANTTGLTTTPIARSPNIQGNGITTVTMTKTSNALTNSTGSITTAIGNSSYSRAITTASSPFASTTTIGHLKAVRILNEIENRTASTMVDTSMQPIPTRAAPTTMQPVQTGNANAFRKSKIINNRTSALGRVGAMRILNKFGRNLTVEVTHANTTPLVPIERTIIFTKSEIPKSEPKNLQDREMEATTQNPIPTGRTIAFAKSEKLNDESTNFTAFKPTQQPIESVGTTIVQLTLEKSSQIRQGAGASRIGQVRSESVEKEREKMEGSSKGSITIISKYRRKGSGDVLELHNSIAIPGKREKKNEHDPDLEALREEERTIQERDLERREEESSPEENRRAGEEKKRSRVEKKRYRDGEKRAHEERQHQGQGHKRRHSGYKRRHREYKRRHQEYQRRRQEKKAGRQVTTEHPTDYPTDSGVQEWSLR